jgi:hypothetical protein
MTHRRTGPQTFRTEWSTLYTQRRDLQQRMERQRETRYYYIKQRQRPPAQRTPAHPTPIIQPPLTVCDDKLDLPDLDLATRVELPARIRVDGVQARVALARARDRARVLAAAAPEQRRARRGCRRRAVQRAQAQQHPGHEQSHERPRRAARRQYLAYRSKREGDAQERDERVRGAARRGEDEVDEPARRDRCEVEDAVAEERVRERLLRRAGPVDRVPARRREHDDLEHHLGRPHAEQVRRRRRVHAHPDDRLPPHAGCVHAVSATCTGGGKKGDARRTLIMVMMSVPNTPP